MDELRKYAEFAGICVAVGVSLIGVHQTRRSRAAAEKARDGLIEVDGKIYRLDQRVDGRLSQLLASNAQKAEVAIDLARVEGHAAGEQAQRDRSSDAQVS